MKSFGYRATLEEQDDTVIWLSHALKNAGADVDILLQGNAVNYSVVSQDPSGLSIGACAQTQPPDIAGDITQLIEKGCTVFVVDEDLKDRGIKPGVVIDGLEMLAFSKIADCFQQYEQVWHW